MNEEEQCWYMKRKKFGLHRYLATEESANLFHSIDRVHVIFKLKNKCCVFLYVPLNVFTLTGTHCPHQAHDESQQPSVVTNTLFGARVLMDYKAEQN